MSREGRAKLLTAEGEDFSAAFLDGARQALALVQRHNIPRRHLRRPIAHPAATC